MAQSSIEAITDYVPWVELYKRFANNNINVIGATAAEDRTTIVLEYSLERQRDGKLIWPKIAVEGPTLGDAVADAENIISGIRGK